MSLSVDGVWKSGVWDETVWADGVWREGAYNPPVVEETQDAGGIPKRRSRYPRKVVIDGVVYSVKSPEDERELLQTIAEKASVGAKILKGLGDEETAKRAQRKAIRIEKRVKKVDNRAEAWLQALRDEDEEILMVIH